MKHLISTSFLIFLLISCKVQQPAAWHPPAPFISKAQKSLVYRASFDYKDYHFSGLCVLKRTDIRSIRIVFLSEMGITLMDFELTPKELIAHKMIEQLDRKILLNFIENDFRQLLMTDLFHPEKVRVKKNDKWDEFIAKGNLKISYYKEKEKPRIRLSVRRGVLGIKKATVKYKYEESDIPQEIILAHNQVKMNLKLTLLEKV